MNITIDELIKLAKESRKMQLSFVLAMIPLLLISYSKTIQDYVKVEVPWWFKLMVLFIFSFLCFWLFLNRKKRITSLDPIKVKEKYESEDMTKNKIKLAQWLKKNSSEKYREQILLSKEEQESDFEDIDKTRRFIYDCFRNIRECRRDGLYDDSIIKSFVYVDGVEFLLNKIEPLEYRIGKALNKKHDRTVFKFFKKLYKKELEMYTRTHQS